MSAASGEPEVIAAIRARRAASTQGAWGWFGDLKYNNIYLATQRGGRQYVMGFQRWGMARAQPVFRSESIMHTLPQLAERGELVTKEYGSREILDTPHPDMRFIASAAQDVDDLLAEVDTLRARLAAAERPTWQPIATAPTDNARPLVLVQFADDGHLVALGWDGIWRRESESWEQPEVYWYWATARGDVEEPTHWAFQDEPLPALILSTTLDDFGPNDGHARTANRSAKQDAATTRGEG